MTADLTTLLQSLLDEDVELILVGGLAAVTHGAPVTTFDVDIVHLRSEQNVDRLLTCLTRLNAYVREPTSRRLPPSREALLGPGHVLLVTDLGPLDCLGAIEGGLSYESLESFTIELTLDGRALRVLTLEKLAELKGLWDDDESRLRAAILRRVLEGR